MRLTQGQGQGRPFFPADFNPGDRTMKKPKPPNGQKGRKSLRVQVTLDPETRERFELIQSTVPEIESLSAAIRYASRITIKYLTTDH
jgi:hypothetical protein